MDTFAKDLSGIAERLKGKAEQLCRQSARVLYNEMSSGGRYSPGTPIDTGNARNSWSAAIGVIPEGNGGDAAAQVESVITDFALGETLVVANNAPYIRRLEYGFIGEDALGRYYAGFGPKSVNGRSSQAPDGFVRPAVEAWGLIVDEVAADLAK